jgi:glycosidase
MGDVNTGESPAMLLLTLRGTSTIYYGDEIGLKKDPDQQASRCEVPLEWAVSRNEKTCIVTGASCSAIRAVLGGTPLLRPVASTRRVAVAELTGGELVTSGIYGWAMAIRTRLRIVDTARGAVAFLLFLLPKPSVEAEQRQQMVPRATRSTVAFQLLDSQGTMARHQGGSRGGHSSELL